MAPSKTLRWPALVLGVALMAHSAFTMVEFRAFQKVNPLASTPLDVVLECLVGLALCCVAAFLMAGEMTGKFAWQELARRSVDSFTFREEFAHFNHRGAWARRRGTRDE